MDLLSTRIYLKYKDIGACEAINENVFKHKTTTCEVQSHIISGCNEKDEKEEDDEKHINEDKTTQYEEEYNHLSRRWR